MNINNRIKYLKKVLAQHANSIPNYLKEVISDEEWQEHNMRPKVNKLQGMIDNVIANALNKDLDGLMNRINNSTGTCSGFI